MEKINIKTSSEKQVINITERINSVLADMTGKDGLCTVTILHTTAALTTADLDPGTDKDMLDAFYEMIPDLDYRHPHDPDHVPDHILSTLIGPSVSLPVEDGKLITGKWQELVLFEFNGPRDRSLIVNLVPTKS